MRELRHARRSLISAAAVLAAGLAPVGLAQAANADTAGPITFESAGYNLGSINGQNDWSSTGAFDQEVVASSRFPSFGAQSLRISSAVTSGSFGDQTFSPPLASPAGELPLLPHFDATLQVGTAEDGFKDGLRLSVSPDNGSGARMSYLRLEDQSEGVHVFFDDVTDPGPVGTSADFTETDIATLDRASAHTLRFSIDFVTGPSNDVVRIFVDGALKVTGTTWEDYYRYDPEQAAHALPPTTSLLLRESGTAAPDTRGFGFLVDNVSLSSTPNTSACDFSTSDKVMTLVADCTTDSSIKVPDGYTLDGAWHTITAVDPPAAHFIGAVVANAGPSATVRNVTVTAANLATACDAFPDSLAGIRLDGASGAITDNTVTGLQQGSAGDGCQEGNAIEVRNTTPGASTPSVNVTGNAVGSYQKTGVLIKGAVSAIVTGNMVTGYGPVGFIAQNGIQVSFGATAMVASNRISSNFYTPKTNAACGVLIYQAGGVKLGKNTFSGNEKDLCNISRGGTFGGV